MPDSSFIFAILAAICLIPSLYRGAQQDLREFRFSEKHFDSLWVNAGIVFLIVMYIALIAKNMWGTILSLIVISVILTLVFLFFAFRYGNGGDWRAMIYIAWIAPGPVFHILCSIGICGIIQSVYWLIRDDIPGPMIARKIPFAVSIFCGYLIGIVLFALW